MDSMSKSFLGGSGIPSLDGIMCSQGPDHLLNAGHRQDLCYSSLYGILLWKAWKHFLPPCVPIVSGQQARALLRAGKGGRQSWAHRPFSWLEHKT